MASWRETRSIIATLAAVAGAVSPGHGIKGDIGVAIGSLLIIDDFKLDKKAI